MKKIIFTTLVIGVLVLASSVLAATSVSFSPGSVNVTQGQTFNVTVTLNPQGVKNYTAKLELKYSANLLEAKSFTFGSNWIPLSQPGYDSIDNINGVLVKSAGYPGGVSSPVTFGTVSFLAKGSGTGAIELANNSFVLDSASQNLLSGAQAKTTVTISPKLVAKVATPKPTLKPSPTSLVPQVTATPSVETTPLPQVQVQQTTLLATIGTILSLGTNNLIVSIIVGVAILAAIFYPIIRRRKKK